MSSWAEIDENNKVIRVLVGDNNDPAGDEGYQWLIDNLGGTWIQTSYNNNFRYNFAGIDFTYDPIDDAFIAPMPECGHEELTLNVQKRWECTKCLQIREAAYPHDKSMAL
jgi:hypothetical protein